MKIRIALTALALAATTLAISSAPSAAASPDALTVSNDAPIANENITVSGTISDDVARPVTLERLNVDGSTWDPVAPTPAATTTSSGAFSFTYRITESQQIRVHAPPFVGGTTSYDDKTTPVVALTLTPTTGVLDPIVDGSSAKATAHFTPVRSGQATQLQVQTIVTKNTNEMPAAIWKTIATGTQNSLGTTVFTLSDPLEVPHKYRAVTTPSAGKGDPTTSNEVTYAANVTPKNTGLSAININTNEGASINTRTRYFEGEFTMSASTKIPACTASSQEVTSKKNFKKMTAKGRGNYSWSFSKKSFTLKLDEKQNLCGMGSSKKWALVANAYDKSLLRSAVAFNLGSKLTNMAWTPKATPVDLYINGSYRGSYSLVERVAIDPARVNIPELKAGDGDKVDGVAIPVGQRVNPGHPNNQEPNISGGYLLEWDFRKGADQNVTAGSRGWVGIKDPENDLDAAGQITNAGISPQQKTYIDGYLDAADKALFGANFKDDANGWQKYIDKASAVDYYIGMEMMKPVDGNMWASVYMYKKRDTSLGANDGKLFFGPMWDFDLAAGSANRAGNTVGTSGWYLRNVISTSAKQSSKTWFNRLNEDVEFRDAVKARWKVLYNDLNSSTFIDAQKAILSDSASENFKKWSVTEHLSSSQVVKGSWAKEIAYLRSWMSSRRSWMNGQY
ncbi:MAG: CotH kinase family protein [Aeromicrobium sp.]